MENDNQKIIFELPENTNAGEIIFEILENNGLEYSSNDDLSKSLEKIVIINAAAKDIFERKISEDDTLSLFTRKLKISEPEAKKLLKELKEKLLPFAKKITIANRSQAETILSEKLITPKKETLGEKEVIKNINPQTENKNAAFASKKSDNYRESIE
jgi:hypothetical protein